MKHCLSLLTLCLLFSVSVSAQTTISPTDPNLQYTGRIDFSDANNPKLYYAGTSIQTKFTGTSLKATFSEYNWGGGAYMGFIIDGGGMIIRNISNGASNVTVDVASGLANTTHTLTIVKRTGPENDYVQFQGLTLDNGASLQAPDPRPERRVELYGNSVTQGVNADNNADVEGEADKHNGWNSYGMILARSLNAECHNQGISGLAVQDGTGFFNSHVNGVGLETTYDKIGANDGRQSAWDFSRYTPHLVIMAMGINDDGFVDASEKETWKNEYRAIINDLRNNRYPEADFVLTIPPLGYERTRMEGYVQEIVNELNDPKVHYFNLTVTVPSAHPYDVIHQAMADQLEDFVSTLDINWGDGGTPPTEPEPEPNEGNVTFRAQGASGTEQVEVRYNDQTVGEPITLSTTFQEYQVQADNPSGNFKLAFVNDNTERDVVLDWLRVGEVQKEAEQQKVNTASWTEAGCGTGSFTQNMYCQGYVDFGTFGDEDGGSGSGSVVIQARGDCGVETMELRIDGAAVADWQVTTSFAEYTYEGFEGGEVRVYFTSNNDVVEGCPDQNLEVDWISVCGTTYQTEEVATETADCCLEDSPEKIFTNGNFSFGTLSCTASTAGRRVALPRVNNQIQQVAAYPNPVSRELTVKGGDDYQVMLYDQYGRLTMQRSHLQGHTSLNVAHIPPGVYVMKIRSAQGAETQQKIIIE